MVRECRICASSHLWATSMVPPFWHDEEAVHTELQAFYDPIFEDSDRRKHVLDCRSEPHEYACHFVRLLANFTDKNRACLSQGQISACTKRPCKSLTAWSGG